MTIGIFHSALPSYSETFILSKIRGLIAKGYVVKVFLANSANDKTDYAYINPYPRKGMLFLLAAPWVLLILFLTRATVVSRFWAKERADKKTFWACLKSFYINAHVLRVKNLDWLHFTFATFAIDRENVASAIGARMAVSLRGFDIGIYPMKHPGCYTRLWRRVDKIHTISQDLYELALHNGLSPEVAVQKIAPAILTEKLKVKTVAPLRESVQIISIGRLEWKKGFVYALQAMHHLKQDGVKFNYKIAGTGTMEEELRFAIYDFGLQDEVQMVGKLSHAEIFEFLNKADLYIQPSVQEGFCNALLEAQGTGLLCIATDAEGLRENVVDGVTGWIVPKRDSAALASRIKNVIELPYSDQEKITKTAKLRVLNEFKIERLVNDFSKFYIG